MKKKICLLLFVATCLLGVGSYNSAQAQTKLGVRGGIYFEQDEVFAGAHFLHKISRRIMFNPNFEYVFVDPGNLFTLNIDAHYDLPSTSNTIFHVGGGLGISRASFNGNSNTETAPNLLAGMSFGRRGTIPFIQLKVMFFDETQLALAAGLTF